MAYEMRNWLQEIEDIWRQGVSGREMLSRHTELIDAFILECFTASSAAQGQGEMALIALGGYGRRELYPFSDIDLLVLHGEGMGQEMQGAVASVLYPLWDAGLQVGHSVRGVDDAVRYADEDVIFQIALLDARLLAGSQSLHQELMTRYRHKVIEGRRDQFVRTIAARGAERRQRYGSHAYLLEPDLKEGRGGLRDIQAMLWLAKAVFGLEDLAAIEEAGMLTAEERRSLETSWDMLIQLRIRLHALSRRCNNRLFFEYQEAMAADFGCQEDHGVRAVEGFMRQVYGHAQAIAVITELFFAQVHDNVGIAEGREGAEHRLEPGISVRGGTLRLLVSDESLAKQPLLLMRLFLQAGRSGLPIHYRSRQLIGRNVHRARDKGFRSARRVAKTFFHVLMSKNPLPALEAMFDTGLLGAYLPEFDAVASLAQHDLYHIYTVDRHQLQSVAELAALRRTEPALFAGLSAPHLLYLAALIHDLGKGQGSDHSVRGAELAAALGARIGLDNAERDGLCFLVRWHLFLPEHALRRDLSDHALIREAARLIGDAERLTMLYLLSIADAKATGPSAWSDWKAALLSQCFLQVRACLEAGCATEAAGCGRLGEEQGAAWLREQTAALFAPGEVVRIALDDLPAEYLISFSPETVARHLRLHRQQAVALHQKVLLFPEEGHGAWSLLILAKDQHGLLAKICGVLALHNLSVLAARIFTWPDGTAVDVLDVKPAAGLCFAEQDWSLVEKDLNRAVNNRLHIALQLHSKIESLGRRRRVQRLRTEVVISNTASAHCTVIEAYGGDRLGALYQLTQTLSDFRLNIHRARIATEVEQLIDVFYVTGEDQRQVEDAGLLAEIRYALLHILGTS